jgi:rhodanese-related sulfurtransferase
VARQFIQNGYRKVYALKGGWDEWVKAKFPTESGEDQRAQVFAFISH